MQHECSNAQLREVATEVKPAAPDDESDGMFSFMPPPTRQGGPARNGHFVVNASDGHLAQAAASIMPFSQQGAESHTSYAAADTLVWTHSTSSTSKNHPHMDSLDSSDAPHSRCLQKEYESGFVASPKRMSILMRTLSSSSATNELNDSSICTSECRKIARGSKPSDKNRVSDSISKIMGSSTTGWIPHLQSPAVVTLDRHHDDTMPEEEEDSPYPEVRASVSNIDDPEMPTLTFRACLIGLGLSALVGAANQFFNLRYPSPYITAICVQIVSFPLGKAAASLLPIRTFRVPNSLRKFGFPNEWSLNPGPFNVKEHTIIVIMANTANTTDYALLLTLTLDKYYRLPKGPAFDVLVVLSNQLIGFGLAGVCRQFLVWPASMIWPQNLVFCTLFNTFHAEDDDGKDGTMTRFRFFTWALGFAALWWLLPGYLFTALSSFNWICWIAPSNTIVNQIFGVFSGLGGSMITFDWAQIAYIGSPLIIPWWAEVNVFFGFVFFLWFLTPVLYYTNLWYFAYMPISTSGIFDRFGNAYNVTSVLTEDGSLHFNQTAYALYSPLYLPVSYISIYSIAFALSTAVIVHCALHHGRIILQKLGPARFELEDVHAKLMRNYPEVPNWWYWSLITVTFLLGIVAIEIFNSGLPVWGLFLALSLPFTYVLPAGIVFATTSLNVTINLLAELIPGYILPGRPIAGMTFKCYAVQGLYAALNFVQDLKLGHYMKIAPRITFMSQLIAGILSALVQIGVKYWLLADVVFFSTSILWSIIGPARQFSPGALYHPLVYWTIVGALLPIPFYLLARRWPDAWYRYVNIPVMLTGCQYIPAATGINYSSWFLFAFIFQYFVRRHKFRWWSKYNFVLSAGLDGGTLLSSILVFLCLQLPRSGAIRLQWWGNERSLAEDARLQRYFSIAGSCGGIWSRFVASISLSHNT